jgi:hypothetical protein
MESLIRWLYCLRKIGKEVLVKGFSQQRNGLAVFYLLWVFSQYLGLPDCRCSQTRTLREGVSMSWSEGVVNV